MAAKILLLPPWYAAAAPDMVQCSIKEKQMGISTTALLEATRLTRQGRLAEATRTIQQALGMGRQATEGDGDEAGDFSPGDPSAQLMLASEDGRDPERLRGPSAAVDVEFRELDDAPQPAERHEPPPVRARGTAGSFTAHVFSFGGHRYRYRLYEPDRRKRAALLPVVVMLHGCKQDADDFARGTGMNEVAEREGFLVLYPEQLRKANGMGCWNWFEPAHQQRGSGEPAMLAALVQATVAAHRGDPQRVYVAGLSAGGAMAATLGELYPELFAAVGVHSGLPPAVAHDVPSAFNAMRKGAPAATAAGAAMAVPTIVFHGSADRTVAPANGEALVRRQLAAHAAQGTRLERSETADRSAQAGGDRACRCEQWRDAQGGVLLERWSVESGPHAWSGGHAGGSFTDPRGPSASERMASFFLQHRRS
jgi:poly(hydroxyalkanoate) depolymerase family esterase